MIVAWGDTSREVIAHAGADLFLIGGNVVGLLLAPIFPPRKGIRLLSVTLSSLERRASGTEPLLRLPL